MRVSVQVESLRDTLNKILTVVDRRSSRPILTYCMIVASQGFLEVMATDTEVSAKIKVEADVELSGAFCISAKNFFDVLKEMPNERIQIEIEETKNILKLECHQIKFSLLICAPDEFPQLTFATLEGSFQLKADNLQNIINKTLHAMCTDETRLYLNGIFLQETDSRLRAVATDGHRLALLECHDFSPEHELLMEGIIIPRKGVNELKKLAESFPHEDLLFCLDESFLYVNAKDVYSLSIRLIVREFPKYQAVIPTKTTFTMTVDKNIFLTALKRIKVLASEKSNGVRMSLKDEELILSANHPTLGDAREIIRANYAGRDITIGFNAKYLLDILSILDGPEICFEFNNEISPVIVKSPALPDFLGIIMPLKL